MTMYIAEVLNTSGMTAAMSGSGAVADAARPVANLLDPRLFLVAGESTGGLERGWQIADMGAGLSICCFEATGWHSESVDAVLRFFAWDTASFGGTQLVNMSDGAGDPENVFPAIDFSSARWSPNYIFGIDAFGASLPPKTGTLSHLAIRSMYLRGSNFAQTRWAVGYLAFGINGYTMQGESLSSIQHTWVLRKDQSYGVKTTLTWSDFMPHEDAATLDAFVERNWGRPVFIFPSPGAQTSDGVAPAEADWRDRGGLMKILSYNGTMGRRIGNADFSPTRASASAGVTLTFVTWES